MIDGNQNPAKTVSDYVEREAKGMAGCELLLFPKLVFDWIGCSNLQIRVPRGCAPSGCNCMHRSSDETFLLSSHSGHPNHPSDAAILRRAGALGERAPQLHAAPELSPMPPLCVEHMGSPLLRGRIETFFLTPSRCRRNHSRPLPFPLWWPYPTANYILTRTSSACVSISKRHGKRTTRWQMAGTFSLQAFTSGGDRWPR